MKTCINLKNFLHCNALKVFSVFDYFYLFILKGSNAETEMFQLLAHSTNERGDWS